MTASTDQTPDHPFHPLTGEFRDPVREAAFRAYALEGDRRQGIVVTGALALTAVLLTIRMYAVTGWPPLGHAPNDGLRLAVFVAAITLLFLVRAARTGQQLDISYAILIAVVAGWQIRGVAARVEETALGIAEGLAAIITIGAAFSGLRLVKGIAITTISVNLLAGSVAGVLPPIAGYLPALVTLPLIGLGATLLLDRSRREAFSVWEQESRERQELELALSELRTLRGFLSVCANCGRIRSQGSWEPLAGYVERRGGATFQAEPCPRCR